MKKIFTLLFIALSCNLAFTQLLTWNFSGQPGTQVTQNSASSAVGIGTGVLSRGSGLSPNAGSNSMNSSGWLESTNDIDDETEQMLENDYYEFTLPIQSGYTADITTVSVTIASSGTGPNGATLFWSVDGYSTSLGTISSGNGTLTGNINQVQGPNSTISFRLYGTRSTTGGGTTGTCRINSLVINGTTSPLPVEMVYFKVKNQFDNNLLFWETASELNNSYFSIEKSNNGIAFREISAVQGNGTSLETHNYNFVDRAPDKGINYYRLKQVDFDSNFEYSKVVSVYFGEGNGHTLLYPTITDDKVTMKFPSPIEEGGSIQIFDLNGKLVKIINIDSETETLEISINELQIGAYFIKLFQGQTTETLRFVKK